MQPSDIEKLLAQLAGHAVPIEELSEHSFQQLADTETPQGLLAVVTLPTWTLADIAPAPRQPVLVLDAVQDPGNVGTLLRTAFGLGAAGAILLRGSADLANPKVLRAAMGATFRFPTASVEPDAFVTWCRRESVEVWIAAAEGGGW